MSFRGRGRGRGGFRGGGGGGGGGGFRGGGGGFRGGGGRGRGGFMQRDMGPPETVVELGHVLHPCEDDLVCKCTNEKIPYFNAPVYLENKAQIGKVDDIFGPMNDFYFSVKVMDSMKAGSFKTEQTFYIDPYKLLPLSRFLPQPKGARGGGFKRGGRGGRGGGFGRGGRGGGFRGRGRGGGFRGGSRGFRGGR